MGRLSSGSVDTVVTGLSAAWAEQGSYAAHDLTNRRRRVAQSAARGGLTKKEKLRVVEIGRIQRRVERPGR